MATPAARNRGFTLLELLVVLVILAVVAATAVLSVGTLGRDETLQDESLRLVTLLRLASEEAVLNGRDLGLHLEEDNYRFLVYSRDELRWLPVDDDRVFRARPLPDGLFFTLAVEDREVILEPVEDEATIEPQIAILSSGDLTAFELFLAREFTDRRFRLAGNPAGVIEIEEIDPDAF